MKHQRQTGITLVGFAFSAIAFIFAVLLIFRVMPIYYEHYTVVNSLRALKTVSWKESERYNMGGAIRSRLSRHFDINRVKSVGSKDVQIALENDGYVVRLDYDAHAKLFSNVYITVKFSDTVVVPQHAI